MRAKHVIKPENWSHQYLNVSTGKAQSLAVFGKLQEM